MNITQSNIFKKKVKKLHPNQKKTLDKAIKEIIKTPSIGVEKKGVLKGVFVYKFTMLSQLTLLAYKHPDTQNIILLSFGSHENFYRDIS